MKIFRRLFLLLLPFWWLLLLAIVLGSLTIVSNMGLLSLAAYLIAASALAPLLVTLMLPIYGVRLFGVLRAATRYTERLISHDVTFRLLAQLRITVYDRLDAIAPSFFLLDRSGDVLSRLVSDVDELQNVSLNLLAPFVTWLIIVVVAGSLFAIFSPILASTTVAFLVFAGLGIPLLTGLLTRRVGKQTVETRATLKAQIVDDVQGVRDILACSASEIQLKKLMYLDKVLGGIHQQMAQVTGMQLALNDAVANLALWTILVLAIPLVSEHTIGGIYLAFLALLVLASFESVIPLAQALQFLGHAHAAGERLFAAIDRQPSVLSPRAPLAFPPTSHTLTFDRVQFSYGSDEGDVLQDVSFCLNVGKRIALVGPSGAGKSTVIRLALRFWDCTHGTILLDGEDIRQYALDDVRKMYSVVAQDTYLFNDSIRGNLLLACPQASDDKLEQIIERVGLTDYVHGLPNKLDTLVGEQGVKLSGGERQRLAIARALLKDAPILLLDEATAHLDPLTEREVLDSLDVLIRNRTTLIVTHRLVAMERMDEILVLDGGCIVERGTHSQLVQANGMYKQLFDVQNDFLSLV